MSRNTAIGFGAHARIRTGDLFRTKWSSVPVEFALILALKVDLFGDPLPQAAIGHRPHLGSCRVLRNEQGC
jgi:hypothetical protein